MQAIVRGDDGAMTIGQNWSMAMGEWKSFATGNFEVQFPLPTEQSVSDFSHCFARRNRLILARVSLLSMQIEWEINLHTSDNFNRYDVMMIFFGHGP